MSSLLAWYKGTQVILKVDDGYLVFDGQEFVYPQDAKYVMLVTQPTNVVYNTPTPVEYDQFVQYVQLTMRNKWVAKVISWSATTPTGDPDVVEASDPLDGECLCGITCLGTNLSYVRVYEDTDPDDEDN